jgi:tRNA A37 threonylcarbamoyladenosine synthetase subunit TsaC/SUA5/YrdC
MISNEIEAVINILQTKKRPGPDEIIAELHQGFKELMPILKLFHTTERERTLLKTFYEVSITLVWKPEKDTHTHTWTKENYRPICQCK